mmetsp:Transcript_56988/g.137740  ORF Transcript_56988/g.137740 Transcript_56988/m.137740 type:complete len:224 (+) Transcript_56988:74-745(+)
MASKLSRETVEKAIQEVVAKSQEKKRKFTETIELQVALKNFDPARDRPIKGSVALPNAPKPKFSVCVFGSAKHCDDAKDANIPFMAVEDLKKFNRNKKLVKKLAKKYDAFVASAALVKQVPRLLGPGLSKAGKFPAVITANDTVEGKTKEVKRTIKFALKFKAGMPMALATAVGNVELSVDQNVDNIIMAVNYLVSLLKKNWQNVKRLHVKSTMGPAFRIYGF